MPDNLNILEKVVDYIQCSDAVATKLQKDAAEKQAQDEKVSALIPKAVEALVKNERIPEHLRDKAASILSDPVKALEVLINTAGHRNASEQAHVGTPSGTNKTASDRSKHSAYLGFRGTAERESDRILFERLGLR